MIEATCFDGSGLQNLGPGLPERSDRGFRSIETLDGVMMDHRRQVATLLLDQRREEDMEVRAKMNQEQLYMLRVGMQIILMGMMNSLDLIITPIETVTWSFEDHIKLLESIKLWQQTYKNYLKELINTKEIHENKAFEEWNIQNPANYETWKINYRSKIILGERSENFAEIYGLSFNTEWGKGGREIPSLLSGLTPAGVVRILNNNDPCVISKIVITQLGPKYPQ